MTPTPSPLERIGDAIAALPVAWMAAVPSASLPAVRLRLMLMDADYVAIDDGIGGAAIFASSRRSRILMRARSTAVRELV